MKIILYVGLFILLFINNSCSSDNNSNDTFDFENNLDEKSLEGEEIVNENLFEDGTYTATVEYYNPDTDYSNTYDLEVEVEDNQVTVIYFPNDGYLDDDHIWPAEIDEEGYAYIEGENGKTYEIYIEK
jgi:hypothetical protein